MWRHLLHYPIIKKSVFAHEQLKVIGFLSLSFYEMDHYIRKLSLYLKQEILQNILFSKNNSSMQLNICCLEFVKYRNLHQVQKFASSTEICIKYRISALWIIEYSVLSKYRNSILDANFCTWRQIVSSRCLAAIPIIMIYFTCIF